MKTILFIFLFSYLCLNGWAQIGSVLIAPETGVSSTQTNYKPNHKISVKTASDNYGFVQKADPIEVGTYIGDANGGFASFGTLGLHNLAFSTNNQDQQLILNILNFAGIGGVPYNALHVYGNIKLSDIKNYSDYAETSLLRVDNDGKLSTTLQFYSLGFPRSAFVPTLTSSNNSIAESDEGGIYFTNAGLSYGLFEAPINLPKGAVITGIEFYFIDNSASNIFLALVSTDLGSESDFNPVTIGSTGAKPGIRSIITNNILNGNGLPIYDGITYQLKVYAQEGITQNAWDGANTQIIAAKLIYKY